MLTCPPHFDCSKKKNQWADPNAGALLTFFQFLLIGVISIRHAFQLRTGGPKDVAPVGARSAAGIVKPGPDGVSVGTPSASWPSWLPFQWLDPVVPLTHYVGMTLMFFTMSYLNNWAFAFHISQPMHMVFRSANLMVSFAFGWAFFGKRYTGKQLLSVVLLTIGAVSATMAEAMVGDTASAAAAIARGSVTGVGSSTGSASAAHALEAVGSCAGNGDCSDFARKLGAAMAGAQATPGAVAAAAAAGGVGDEASAAYYFTWLLGILILTTVLVLQTLLSFYQNHITEKYGKAPYEAMFYMHTFSLPMFLAQPAALAASAARWSASSPASTVLSGMGSDPSLSLPAQLLGKLLLALVSLGGAGGVFDWPIMWLYVALNVVTQYVCLVGVYNLISLADPLTVNVTLTVRKFVSLMLSIYVFNNTFTALHWLGAVLVFGGAVLYSQWGAPPPAAPKAAGDKGQPATSGSPKTGALSGSLSAGDGSGSNGSGSGGPSALTMAAASLCNSNARKQKTEDDDDGVLHGSGATSVHMPVTGSSGGDGAGRGSSSARERSRDLEMAQGLGSSAASSNSTTHAGSSSRRGEWSRSPSRSGDGSISSSGSGSGSGNSGLRGGSGAVPLAASSSSASPYAGMAIKRKVPAA